MTKFMKEETAERHGCLVRVDKELKKHNTRLVVNLMNIAHVFVATERIRVLRDGKSAKKVIATFCPFCGDKLSV